MPPKKRDVDSAAAESLLPGHFLPAKISRVDFHNALAQYHDMPKKPSKELQGKRWSEVPNRVRSRMEGEGKDGAYLERDEVVSLIEWKLKNGTFRPGLLQRVQSNTASAITSTTQSAYAIPSSTLTSTISMDELDVVKRAVAKLSGLNGIGPAGASLLLAVAYPETVPFFSDEVAAWFLWGNGGTGWKRKLKYDVKEYMELLRVFVALRERIDVSAQEVEKVAWVLRHGGDTDVEGKESPSSNRKDMSEKADDAGERKRKTEVTDEGGETSKRRRSGRVRK